jgi:hypothetical protein
MRQKMKIIIFTTFFLAFLNGIVSGFYSGETEPLILSSPVSRIFVRSPHAKMKLSKSIVNEKVLTPVWRHLHRTVKKYRFQIRRADFQDMIF